MRVDAPAAKTTPQKLGDRAMLLVVTQTLRDWSDGSQGLKPNPSVPFTARLEVVPCYPVSLDRAFQQGQAHLY
jgi:hypothetical protein